MSGQSQTYSSESFAESRYTKDKILEIYRSRQTPDDGNDDVSRLFVNNWDPSQANGSTARGWGKSSDTRDHTYGPEICWDQSGQVQPIGLEEMTALERTVSSRYATFCFDVLNYDRYLLAMLTPL